MGEHGLYGNQLERGHPNQGHFKAVGKSFGVRQSNAQTSVGPRSHTHRHGVERQFASADILEQTLDIGSQENGVLLSVAVLVMFKHCAVAGERHRTHAGGGFNIQYCCHVSNVFI